jgi:hypothetical protein
MKHLATDLGGSRATCALIDGTRVLDRRRIKIPAGTGLKAALELVGESFRALLSTGGGDRKSTAGIAVSFCGLVDPVRRRVLSTNANMTIPLGSISMILLEGARKEPDCTGVNSSRPGVTGSVRQWNTIRAAASMC